MGAYRAADPAGQARRRQTARRYPLSVINGVMYILSTGCQWRSARPPKDLPPRSTVHDYLRPCANQDGTLDRIHDALYFKCREKAALRSQPHGLHHRQSECEKR